MLANRLQRYVLRETLLPAFGAVAILTLVLLSGRILRVLELVIDRGVSFADALALFARLLPAFLVLTLPFALMLGILFGFSRLSADSEIVAMRAAGVSYYALLRPVLAVALATSLLTGWLSIQLEPESRHAFRQALLSITSQHATLALEPGVFNRALPGLVIYPRSILRGGEEFDTVFIADSRLAANPTLFFAKHGRIVTDPATQTVYLQLSDGTVHGQSEHAGEEAYQLIRFDSYQLALQQTLESMNPGNRSNKVSEMTMGELLDGSTKAASPRQRRKHLAEFHQRLLLAVAPLVFALLATPLGISSHRSGKSGGFTAGLLVFLGYYLSNSFCETLVIERNLPAVATLWAPTVFLTLCGIELSRRTVREQPFGLPGERLLRQTVRRLLRRR